VTYSTGIQVESRALSLLDVNSSAVGASEIKFNNALLSESVVTTQGRTDDLERREIECNLPATINNTNNLSPHGNTSICDRTDPL
jgi:hypothetical protein